MQSDYVVSDTLCINSLPDLGFILGQGFLHLFGGLHLYKDDFIYWSVRVVDLTVSLVDDIINRLSSEVSRVCWVVFFQGIPSCEGRYSPQ